jgi:hypothetical protein
MRGKRHDSAVSGDVDLDVQDLALCTTSRYDV